MEYVKVNVLIFLMIMFFNAPFKWSCESLTITRSILCSSSKVLSDAIKAKNIGSNCFFILAATLLLC
jgi:hypothetical protein